MKFRKSVALLLGLNMTLSPALSPAAPVIPGFSGKVTLPAPVATVLPQERGTSWTGVGSITRPTGTNELVINQNAPQAIINWNSFNIGATAAVRFNQRDSQGVAQKDWAALNRIYDRDPSVIYGRLTADGKVYLLNQNGIMFGAGSQVNVHSLVASSLNLRDADFMNRALRFNAENYQDAGYLVGNTENNLLLPPPGQDAVVANQGTVTAGSGGSVLLIGPNVENSGTIVALAGKIDLIASIQSGQDLTGTVADVQVTEFAEKGSNDVVYRSIPTAGQAQNLAGGVLQADQGRVGLFGNQVRQDGLIRSISAVKRGGEIFLAASERVTTGANSLTDVSISDSPEKVDQSFSFSGGQVSIAGIYTTTNASNSFQQILRTIEHNGSIQAPSGRVELRATGRVYLENGSSINVAGLWVDGQAADNQIEAQLNSVELKDSYGQKYGFLKGEKITVDLLTGTTLGDISGSYLVEAKNARQRATKGGSITIGAPELYIPGTTVNQVLDGIVIRQGALLDFSGGGFRYSQGFMETSRLLSGTSVYHVSTAPQFLSYSKLLGSQTVDYSKFGQSETYSGLYMGGGTAVKDATSARTVGSDAGKVTLEARQVVLDGDLQATITRGLQQTVSTAHSPTDSRTYDISVARGLEEPTGGTLLIGRKVESGGAGAAFQDFRTREIVVAADPAQIWSGTGPNDLLVDTRTVLSATTLNNLHLASLGLFSNTSLTIDAATRLSLAAGGSLEARARVIDQQGEIDIPSGKVSLYLQDNISSHPQLQGNSSEFFTNSQYARQNESFTMASGSRISVAGERIDNSRSATVVSGLLSGRTAGGSILIKDNTVGGTKGVVIPMEGYDPGGHSLIVRSGAGLDVSGGYTINPNGTVSGADAGTLELRSATISLNGDLNGLSLAGKKGGQLLLHAGEVKVADYSLSIPDQVAADLPLPDTLSGKLVLGEHRLDNSGFSRIELTAINNLTLAEGVSLIPSIEKLAMPIAENLQNRTAAVVNAIQFAPAPLEAAVSPDVSGATTVRLNAGVNIYTDNDFSSGISVSPFGANVAAGIVLAAESKVITTPGGAISLSAPALRVEGSLEALSGSISLKASGTGGDVSIASGASINANGYNKPTLSTITGLAAGASPQPGGSIALESVQGRVILEQGALVDVSGSEPTANLVKNAAGLPETIMIAGNPGSLSITSAGGLLLDGQIRGRASIQGQAGGTLSVRTNDRANAGLTISEEDIRRYRISGFDALTFGSAISLDFQSGMDLQIGRSLTLDAPLIKGNGSDAITLNSPWIRLTNSSLNLPASLPAEQGSAVLTLNGEWLDIEGTTSLAGFGTARLLANRDLRLADKYYVPNGGTSDWYGGLQTGGELILQGARIYPTTAANFTITSGRAVSILAAATADTTPIYSAGGNLTIKAATGINHAGYLAAPMGQISLQAETGRVYLADGSLTRTSGDAQVNYGSFDGTFWTVKDIDSSTKGPLVEGVPENAIALTGQEVIIRSGATLDNSGGGSIYTYLFQPGIEGSYNPISIDGRSSANSTVRPGANRFVILPDNSVQLPGFTYTDAAGRTRLAGAVHLEATRLNNGTWLNEGVYSLLPESYAFLPGALIISDTGSAVASGLKLRTQEGYQVLAGYDTYAGTSATSPLKGFSLRSAADVLNEGNFGLKDGKFTSPEPLVAGNSGDLTIKGNSTILSGTLKRNELNGFTQGVLSLAGKEITIGEGTVALPASFDFNSRLSEELRGKMLIAAAVLSGGGPVVVGDRSVTDSIMVKAGSSITAPQITLAAKNSITLEQGTQPGQGAQIAAGTATLSSPDGSVVIQANAEVHASGMLNLTAASLDLKGDLNSDHDISLSSKNIVIAPDTDSSPGLHLSDKLIQSFKNLDNVTLVSTGNSDSGGNVTFLKDTKLEAKENLTIDAARLVNGGTGDSEFKVTMSAPDILLKNSGKEAAEPARAPTNGSSFTVNANTTTLANDIVVDGFKQFSVKALVDFDPLNTDANPDNNITAVNDMTMAGAGSLKTSGDLDIAAARLTTTYNRDSDNVYHSADFAIKASGTISITKSSNGSSGSSTTPGGILSMTGSSITDKGIIVMPSGQVNLTATDGDVTLEGASIQTGGFKQLAADKKTYDYAPGGQITLRSDKGAVTLNKDQVTSKIESVLDVSADKDGGDAGAIALIAPTNGIDLTGGSIKGSSAAGQGGSFTIDTNNLNTVDTVNKLSGLLDKVTSGGFNDRLNIRTRSGNLELAENKTITAREIILAADGADITLKGKIDASNSAGDGGRVELYAKNSLTMQNSIDAHGTGTRADGGEVWLGSGSNNDTTSSMLTLANGSKIDVSGGADGKGGSVYLRALRNGTGVNMDLKGEIKGAAQVVAEAFTVYDNTTGVITDSATKTNEKYNDDSYLKFKQETDKYMETATLARPTGVDSSTEFHFRPGVEVRRSGDLALTADWDLTTWRYADGTGALTEPGILTIRSTGNQTFGSSTAEGVTGYKLTDAPTPQAALNSKAGGTMQDSWGINLAAGADLKGASPLATVRGIGNLLLGPSYNGGLNTDASGNAKGGALVYTENAPVRFASGNNTDIGFGVAGKFMINDSIRYNIGTYAGVIRGETGGDLTVRAGAIQSAIGDIDLRVSGDLSLLNKTDSSGGKSSIGTVRTTGEYTPGAIVESSPGGSLRASRLTDYWTYCNGGDISLNVSGAVNGRVNNTVSAGGLGNAWDAPVGGSFNTDKFLAASYVGADASEGIITMAGGNIEVLSGGAFTCQTGLFGTGDLRIFTGGDLNGRFRLTRGDGILRSMGNFGAADAETRQVLELADARLKVAAQGDMHIGAVLNPDNCRDLVMLGNKWNLTYSYADPDIAGSRNSAAAFHSLTGSVSIDGTSFYDGYAVTGTGTEARRRLLPADFSILAAGDIKLQNSFALAPSTTGNLLLAARGSIDGAISAGQLAQLSMADIKPESVYGRFSRTISDQFQSSLFAGGSQSNYLLHAGDRVPVTITAGHDITNLQLDLNKQAAISAGHDINELRYRGQNTGANDISSIQAGHDIYYSYSLSNPSSYDPGIAAPGLRQGGPGTLLVQAGNTIDLGNSAGIQSYGSSLNPILGAKGSTVIVVAGAKTAMTAVEAVQYFHGADSGKKVVSDVAGLIRQMENADAGELVAIAQQLAEAGPEFIEQVTTGTVGLKLAGNAFTNMQILSKTAGVDNETRQKLDEYAQQVISQVRTGSIQRHFDVPAADGSGSINMVSSQISTLTGPDELFILARSDLNVGKSTFVSDSARQSTGIFTASGGPIDIYSGGDANVNESRVMTFLGGDITFWSDKGNINAGRGAKTAISASPPKTVLVKVGPPPEYQTVFSPPSVGSGIRALTYDPNTTPGGVIPEPGNIYGFAPEGIIDAGEAGIAGGKITLGATQVLNVKNISFSAGSVGVPTSSDAGVSIGALAGAGSLSDNSKMMEQSSTLGSAKEKSLATQTALLDDFMTKLLDVKVVGFDLDERVIGDDRKEQEQEKDKEKETQKK